MSTSIRASMLLRPSPTTVAGRRRATDASRPPRHEQPEIGARREAFDQHEARACSAGLLEGRRQFGVVAHPDRDAGLLLPMAGLDHHGIAVRARDAPRLVHRARGPVHRAGQAQAMQQFRRRHLVCGQPPPGVGVLVRAALERAVGAYALPQLQQADAGRDPMDRDAALQRAPAHQRRCAVQFGGCRRVEKPSRSLPGTLQRTGVALAGSAHEGDGDAHRGFTELGERVGAVRRGR
ncbi:MAG TPA: hypothetical protein PK072_10745 [Quisquiliibacterium sp.]|nr:hypothetical protein [Quisquiliibacterium sp.]